MCFLTNPVPAGALHQHQQDRPDRRLQANDQRGRFEFTVEGKRNQRFKDRSRDSDQIYGI